MLILIFKLFKQDLNNMDVTLACGDSNIGETDIDKTTNLMDENQLSSDETKSKEKEGNELNITNDKPQTETVEENDLNLKERIANCRKIIESLKLELTEEKAKLQEDSHAMSSHAQLSDPVPVDVPRCYTNNTPLKKYITNTLTPTDYLYSSSVDSKLRCDDNLMEYEKQLQRYQETLTMAQTEKKNAIRKQMLAKVYKLKLLEVENQCNIELIRVKQSLECLEPLKIIVNKWKMNDNTCDFNNYELIPRYPELNPISAHDVNFFTDDEKSEFIAPNEDPQL